VTGRSTRAHPRHDEPEWSVDAAADAVTEHGGVGIAAPCDHQDDAQVAALFDRVRSDHRRLDVLVNNAVGADQTFRDLWRNQFGRIWQTDVEHWDQQMTIGVRSNFVAARHGLPLMIGHPALLVFTAERAAAEARHPDPIADLRAHATARMAFTFAEHLRAEQVTCLGLTPGDVITHVRRQGDDSPWQPHQESVFYAGRAIAAIAADTTTRLDWTGRTVDIGQCAERYGFTDITGNRPDPHATT
jgi:NAD(P)-dependent dehydrogenase (short-subunit alcohol dehydrogenase family)